MPPGGSGLEWLFAAQTLFQKFSEAGFVVLSHQCYTVECIPEPSYQTPCFLSCEPVTNGFPSLSAALPPMLRPSYLRICSGSHCIILHSSLLSFSPYITCHEYPHILPFLHTATCKCKCKTFLLPNFSLSSSHLSLLDSTPWGCKIISSSATMLGLFLHSPQSNLLLCMTNRCLYFPFLHLLHAAPLRPLNYVNLSPQCKNALELALP